PLHLLEGGQEVHEEEGGDAEHRGEDHVGPRRAEVDAQLLAGDGQRVAHLDRAPSRLQAAAVSLRKMSSSEVWSPWPSAWARFRISSKATIRPWLMISTRSQVTVTSEHRRVSEQGLGDAHPLPVALGEVLDQAFHDLRDAGGVGDSLQLRGHLAAANTLDG